MKKTTNPVDNSASQQNSNKGTPNTNPAYDKNQGNRGKQLNPNQKTGSQSIHPQKSGKKR